MACKRSGVRIPQLHPKSPAQRRFLARWLRRVAGDVARMSVAFWTVGYVWRGYVRLGAGWRRRPTVRWSEGAQRWMAWVRFPDGSRRKVERVRRADAEADLQKLLAERASAGVPPAGRERLVAFGEVIDAWLEAGCPSAAPNHRTRHVKEKSPNTVANARCLLGCARAPGARRPAGRPDEDRADRAAVRRHGCTGLRHEHDRPDLGLPEPGLPVRPAARPGAHEPGGGGDAAGGSAGEAAQVALRRAGPAAAGRGAAGGLPPGDVADRVDVRAPPGGAGRVALVLRRPRRRGADDRGGRAGPGGRQALRGSGGAEDSPVPPADRPAPSAGRRPAVVTARR